MKGFKVGADDYIPKPFNPKLLIARVVANLRRVYRYDAEQTSAQTKAEEQSGRGLAQMRKLRLHRPLGQI